MRVRIDLAALLCVLAACGGSDSSSTGTNNSVARVTVTSASTSVTTGQSVQLQAAALTASGAQIASPGIFTWSSSSSSIASVDQGGRVTGVTPGQAIISATVSGVAATVALIASPPAAGPKSNRLPVPLTVSAPPRSMSSTTSAAFLSCAAPR